VWGSGGGQAERGVRRVVGCEENGMGVLLILIVASLTVATGFLVAFVWAVRSGQYEDTCTPSMRVLADDSPPRGGPHSGDVESGREMARETS
jgi:cbb3-type cytochrome oxidase maturation protein